MDANDYWSNLPKFNKPSETEKTSESPPGESPPPPQKEKKEVAPSEVEKENSCLKFLSFILLFFILLFLMGMGGAYAYFNRHPESFLNLPDYILKPTIKVLNTIPFRSPRIIVLNSIFNLENLRSFEGETSVNLKLLSKTNKDLGSVLFKISSPIKINPEEEQGIDSEAKFLLEINYEEYRKEAASELEQTLFSGASAILPLSPVIVAGDLKLVRGDLYLYLRKLPKTELLNLEPLLDRWWVQKDVQLETARSERFTEEEERKLGEEFNKLLTKIKFERLPTEIEEGREFYKIQVIIEKEYLKEFLVNIPETGDDFYESKNEKEKLAQNFIDAFGRKGEKDFRFLYLVDTKYKLPGKIIFEGEFSEFENFSQALLKGSDEQSKILGLETPASELIPKPTQLLPEKVSYSLVATLKDYNKPVFVQSPSEAKSVEEIPWAEVLLPLQVFMAKNMKELYGPPENNFSLPE